MGSKDKEIKYLRDLVSSMRTCLSARGRIVEKMAFTEYEFWKENERLKQRIIALEGMILRLIKSHKQ